MTTENKNETGRYSSTASAKVKTRIKIFALGRTGAVVAEELIRDGYDPESFVTLKADAAARAKSPASVKLRLQHGNNRGVTVGRKAGELLPKIKELCEEADMAFVIAGMGGRTGTEFAPLIAEAAKEAGLVVLGFTTLPFDWEGSLKQEKAHAALGELRAATDGVVCLPNQKVFRSIGEKTRLPDTFKLSNALLREVVRGVARMITCGGLIDIHLSDLCALIGGCQTESAFAAAEASGPNRSREVVEKLIAYPLLDGGDALREAEAVLVSVVGGSDLILADVNCVMEQLSRHCESARVVVGAAVDESLEDRLAVTLLVSRRGSSAGQTTASAGTLLEGAGVTSRRGDSDLKERLLPPTTASRQSPRIANPTPDLTRECMQKLLAEQRSSAGYRSKGSLKMRQTQLQLEIVSKGRFDKSEPTIHNGEDLDLPTYVRRGVVLN